MYSEISRNKRNSVILMTIFLAIIIGIGYFIGYMYGSPKTAYSGIFFASIISLVWITISYFSGDKIALAASGARALKKEESPYVYNMVENLCIASGQPMPKVYIMDDPAINAFATGRNPETASIALTTGAIKKLANEELEGVIAHELSHVKNYDIRFMMLVAVLVGTISILADMTMRMGLFGGRRRSDDREGGGSGLLLIIGLIFLIISPIVAELIKLAISRRREYLADASGALLTRYPEGLARALEKIALENQPMRQAATATAHLFIANPFGKGKLMSLFSTHPPIEERIKKLRTMGV